MRWETLEDALAVLETEREYDGYFCSVQDALIIVILGSLYGQGSQYAAQIALTMIRIHKRET